MDRWRGKVAVVTGASSGIGKAIVMDLVPEGFKVLALARRQERLQELEEELNGKGHQGVLKGFQCDLTKEEDIKAAFKWVEDNWGAVNVLVNNAGAIVLKGLEDTEYAEIDQLFKTNVIALSACVRESIKSMKKHQVKDTHIIVINSDCGHHIFPFPGLAAYTATKYSVTVLCRCLLDEMNATKSKIKVTSISPGLVESEMATAFMDHVNNHNFGILPAKEISNGVLYALSTPPNVNVTELMIQPLE